MWARSHNSWSFMWARSHSSWSVIWTSNKHCNSTNNLSPRSFEGYELFVIPATRWAYAKKWNESGFRPPLCTYRLNWARRTSWGWWDDWDDTVLQTQDSKFEPWRSEAEHATSRTRRLPTILTFTRGWGRNIFCFFQTAETYATASCTWAPARNNNRDNNERFAQRVEPQTSTRYQGS